MKKGFIHIVEIVVISLVVFILVIQISTIPRASTDWERTKLLLAGNDILFALNEKGVNWLNSNDVEDALGEALNGTNLNYGVEVRNAIKANITVGCIKCDSGELSELRSALASFTINRERVRFNTTSLEDPLLWLDVAYLGEDAVTGPGRLERFQLEEFLRAGKGIVEVRDLAAGDIDYIQEDIFGLETWGNSPSGSNIIFAIDETSRYWNINKYFLRLWGDPEWVSFEEFLDRSENVTVPAGEEDRIILEEYVGGAPALIVNEFGGGRTVWLSDGDNTLEERRVLIKALVAWAAGETYQVVPAYIKEPTSFSLHTVINQDMFQPVEIVLSLGYIF